MTTIIGNGDNTCPWMLSVQGDKVALMAVAAEADQQHTVCFVSWHLFGALPVAIVFEGRNRVEGGDLQKKSTPWHKCVT